MGSKWAESASKLPPKKRKFARGHGFACASICQDIEIARPKSAAVYDTYSRSKAALLLTSAVATVRRVYRRGSTDCAWHCILIAADFLADPQMDKFQSFLQGGGFSLDRNADRSRPTMPGRPRQQQPLNALRDRCSSTSAQSRPPADCLVGLARILYEACAKRQDSHCDTQRYSLRMWVAKVAA